MRINHIILIFLLITSVAAGDLYFQNELTLGRQPVANIVATIKDMSKVSFFDAIWGEERREFRNDDGELLRVDNPKENEQSFLLAVFRGIWVTFSIATLGTTLAIFAAIPLSLAIAENLKLPLFFRIPSRFLANALRSIHTLVFGLIFVGIVGLGPMAGILAIAAHSCGSFAKLFAESIESMDMRPIQAIKATGATQIQVFFYGIVPMVLPQFVSTTLYLWEFNTRDSTILGIIGAGGIGLLISEAISLYQWDRLASLIIFIISFVALFDLVSRQIRMRIVHT